MDVADIPEAQVYADRVSLDEGYLDQHFRLVMGKPGARPFKLRQSDHPILAPWSPIAAMAELDTLCLAATGALPSELRNE